MSQHFFLANQSNWDYIEYKWLYARTRQVFKKTQHTSWHNYVSIISSSIHHIKGAEESVKNNWITIANYPFVCSQHYCCLNSSSHSLSNPTLITIKSEVKKICLAFTSFQQLPYNLPFILSELKSELSLSNDCSQLGSYIIFYHPPLSFQMTHCKNI